MPPLPDPSPRRLGYRMPAEWAPHEATWLTWPHCEETWPGKLASVFPAYAAMIDALRIGERVYVNVLSEGHRAFVAEYLRERGVPTGEGSNVVLHVLPTEDEWVRDYGALFVTRPGTRAATDWVFNSWGGKYPRTSLNNRVPEAMAAETDAPVFECPIVMEGGALDVNGEGVLLTTEACLLNPNRNPDLSKEQIEAWLREGLGVETIWWLGDGIAGDDTDGHVDDLTRFVAPDTVVTVVEPDPSEVNHAPLQENLERLHTLRFPDGRPLRVVELPMPAPRYYQGERLPASYANFYIGNAVVLLPVFGDPNDAVAVETLQGFFPDRRLVGIPAEDLTWGLGACHCLTQQVPAVPPA